MLYIQAIDSNAWFIRMMLDVSFIFLQNWALHLRNDIVNYAGIKPNMYLNFK